MPDDTTRWTVSVSKDTDVTVRDFLARRGMKEDDLSSFVEDAVRLRVFDQTIAESRTRFADLPPGEAEALINEAVAVTQQARTRKPRWSRFATSSP